MGAFSVAFGFGNTHTVEGVLHMRVPLHPGELPPGAHHWHQDAVPVVVQLLQCVGDGGLRSGRQVRCNG